MTNWYSSVIKPNIAGYNVNTGLSLDDFKCNHSENFTSLLEESNVRSYKIPPHYTALLQPCDVGINKSLKDRLKNCASNWGRENMLYLHLVIIYLALHESMYLIY